MSELKYEKEPMCSEHILLFTEIRRCPWLLAFFLSVSDGGAERPLLSNACYSADESSPTKSGLDRPINAGFSDFRNTSR